MGHKLTLREKTMRHSLSAIRQARADAGPLYQDHVAPDNVFTRAMEKRHDAIRHIEYMAELCMDRWDEAIFLYSQLRRLAWKLLGEHFVLLDSHCLNTYPSASYWCSFWAKRLTTDEDVVLGWKVNLDPKSYSREPSHVFPPPGWTPPLRADQLPFIETKCPKCGYYHSPATPCVEYAVASGKLITSPLRGE